MYNYICKGTCSKSISFDMDENHIVTNVKFTGGCPGNTQGVARLCEGRKAEELADILEGIPCRPKTSCPDQLSKALRQALSGELTQK